MKTVKISLICMAVFILLALVSTRVMDRIRPSDIPSTTFNLNIDVVCINDDVKYYIMNGPVSIRVIGSLVKMAVKDNREVAVQVAYDRSCGLIDLPELISTLKDSGVYEVHLLLNQELNIVPPDPFGPL